MTSDINAEDYSAEEYQKAYNAIYTSITMCAHKQDGKCAYVLGGQPGSGKSTFYSGNESLDGYIAINGDQYRRYHPRYLDIIKYDLDNYANRTQPFVNRVVEQLINDLSAKGYNIIIEGTLRNPEVPIKTCDLLKSKGYDPKLVIVACDAEQSWRSTIYRAQLMQEIGEKPRLVPIDKYNAIVNNLPESLEIIANRKCFSSISIISRDNELLYRHSDKEAPAEVLKSTLNLDNWNRGLGQHVQEYMNAKIDLIRKESERLHGQESFSRTYDEMPTCERGAR
jgi:UDP-N-acetylglucosamine kinase